MAEYRPDMEKQAEWAALTTAAHFPKSGRHSDIENGTCMLCYLGGRCKICQKEGMCNIDF